MSIEHIKDLKAEEILDSRGNPTLRVTAISENYKAAAEVPSGASTGKYEATELRDGDMARYGGKGVRKAIAAVLEKIKPAILGIDPADQIGADKIIASFDSLISPNSVPGNATIGASLAVARLGSVTTGRPLYEHLKLLAKVAPSRKLPYLMANLVNGGKHAATPLAFQEYHLVPETEDLEEALNLIYFFQAKLKEELRANIGDEGGFVPDITDVERPLAIFAMIMEKYKLTGRVKFSLDVAASSFFVGGSYEVAGKRLPVAELTKLYEGLAKKYPMLSIEDPYDEEDFDSFADLHAKVYGMKVVGDDLTTTNESRLKEAISRKSVDAIIIKTNQIGTLSQALDTVRLARQNNVECVVSHRSGETNDTFIADLAVAIGAWGVKFGALQRGERIAKYNRLKEIYGTL